ncbi:phosphoglucomutase/phosphomannomutase alpha/beta/alpha domain I [Caldicellulosiruptor kronotskyensis 2002]|uniref:Phosphoglucomutase n=1 Tax=Caldicellulosiruptor kronotskyensis (strain DSM 18902 / VKM B-2412 / 2002) TaxID=632348 RepID=E4SCG2_CALK2|nr:phosphoglucomutase/phosphomannomutase family protein [Caldicellulosiruptor kronotskyensis]ADQ45017.1 phosphoglucomutase/phosphomannomutase alpha/beta/alpha domain I [Caldicellulosiruptor kronotskyensis 2002]
MIKFGTGGWRAIIGDDFTKENIQKVAQAVSIYMKEKGIDSDGIVLGYDRRFLSDKAARWFSEVLSANGIKVFFINKVAPTPLVMFTVKKLNTKFGATVTASHNPADYNGIKLFIEEGRDAPFEVTSEIETIANSLLSDSIKRLKFEKAIENGWIEIIDPFDDYIDAILSMIDIEAIKKRKLRILLDPMYGVSRTSLQTILITARCDVDTIHERHDTLFGGRLPSPTTSTLYRLKHLVVEKGYDLGIGTDGDADRVGIIDEIGNFIHPNDILVLLYYYFLKYKGWKGPVVRNLATTHLLDRIASSFGEKCYEVPVGFKYISAKMEETGAIIGGESSGGLTIKGHIKGKDGIFAATLLVELICKTGRKLSEILEEIHRIYGILYMVENDFSFEPEEKEKIWEILFDKKHLPDFPFEISNVSYIDGVKVYFKNGGWVLARFSGTEPLLRIYSEMEEKVHAEEVCKIFAEFLNLR